MSRMRSLLVSLLWSGALLAACPPATAARPGDVAAQGDFTMNFAGSDVRDVVKSVFGSYLGRDVEMAADVQGPVTLATEAPLQRSQVLPLLKEALQYAGFDVTEVGDRIRVAMAAGPRPAHGADYGIVIIPVRYARTAQMPTLLARLAPTQAVLHADPDHNALIVEGSEQERAAVAEDLSMFDARWLEGMSYALYTPSSVDAEELVKELKQVMTGVNPSLAGSVKLVAIDRLNAVLAISARKEALDQTQSWEQRLDHPGEGTDKRVFVYQVQNGRAADLAATLSKLMGAAPASNDHAPANTSIAAVAGPQAPPPAPSNATTISVGSSGPISVTADENNNAVVVLATPREYGAVEAALRKLDAPPLQVYLEAAIAEVTLTDDLKYGVQYFYQPGGAHQIALSDTASGAIAPAFPGFSYMFSRGSNIKVILDALSGVTHVQVVSSPELMVLNNQPATLQVGDRVPIATQQAVGLVTADTAIVNSIQYLDTGVILKVTPRVNHGGLVMLDISQEVSQVTSTTTSNIDSPTIQERKINSSVAVQNGQTVALGGLIMENHTNGKSGIPFLNKVPVLGNLFGDTSNSHTRTELMVLITPHVVENTEQAQAVTNELRRKFPAVQALLEAAR
ncbi:MAG: type II secretion system secretin GspD [Alphaproteobacteria bacterium]|nr:type II secretion system secretin GspD [Alphaproteobacteria bacterium]